MNFFKGCFSSFTLSILEYFVVSNKCKPSSSEVFSGSYLEPGRISMMELFWKNSWRPKKLRIDVWVGSEFASDLCQIRIGLDFFHVTLRKGISNTTADQSVNWQISYLIIFTLVTIMCKHLVLMIINTGMKYNIFPGELFFQDICVDFIEYWLWNQLWAQNSKLPSRYLPAQR